MKKQILFIAILLIISFLPSVSAKEINQEKTCFIYFTGIGCPHCAKTDPVVLIDLLKHENIFVIEYEIYHHQENAQLLLEYNNRYNFGLGIPLIILNKEKYILGDYPILDNINSITKLRKNPCLLIKGPVNFDNLDLTALPGKPKIWTNKKILIKTSGGNNNKLLKNLLISSNISNLSSILEEINYKIIEPQPVALSGKNVYFDNAIQLNGWIFQWNGPSLKTSKCPSCPPPKEWSSCINGTKKRINYKCNEKTNFQCIAYEEIASCITEKEKLTIAKLISLAAVDAINPCALAVLTLMLIAILTYNPKKKRNILLAGLAFITSVFIMYLFYGLVIIKFFQIVQALTAIRLWLYKFLGFFAIILGILNIKDFIKYKPGGPCTEMPLSLRPKVQKIISKITSPQGAFGVGIFVTIFLLPCTIGPYVIAGGILSAFEIIKTIPPLLLYNLIFVMPMIAITLMIYGGLAKIEDVSGWKEKNIRNLHLIAGIIMFTLGIAMFFGFI